MLSTPDVCQGRCLDQDFVVVKYVGQRTDTGKVFDERYATRPLIYELGTFYMPGFDEGLEGACVGSKLRFTYPGSPPLADADADTSAILPANTPISFDVELVGIKYSLFGEKMRDASSKYWFAEAPLTLTSSVDFERGHAGARPPVIIKDNPFSVAAGEVNLITNPSSVLGPLWGTLPEFKLPKLF